MNGLGPFEVSGEQIERLADRFTAVVNALLDVECRAADLLGHELRTSSRDTTADGGVDAHVVNAVATSWIPQGESAWQFKRGDLAPAACKEELRKAQWARDLLAQGASYRLVLGARLTANRIGRRRRALLEEAQVLGLGIEEPSIQVIDGDMLARWASEFPELAVSPLLRGRELAVLDFGQWSQSIVHQLTWVSSESRESAIGQVRAALVAGPPGVRVVGPSGIGKTRVVMEALRGEWEPLVAYIPDAERAGDVPLNDLLSSGRAVILVIDECEDRRHDKLCEQLPTGSPLKLVTIGERQGYSLHSPIVSVGTLEDDALQEFVRRNYAGLWAEALRFIVEKSSGNVRAAAVLSDRIEQAGPAHAAELIRADDLAVFVGELLPEGRSFFLSTILALVERVGWDRELRGQLETLAAFAGASTEELEQVGRELADRGLLARQGRYRMVTPHPVAVVLAADAWREMASRIVDELLPVVDEEMALGLLTRAADLGAYEPARGELRRLMAPNGLLGTLRSIGQHSLGRLLTQLAIIAPDETMRHIAQLIEGETPEGLASATDVRRDLVWTLEKLAWHTTTFEPAADSLLRLSLAENETYSNNATGVWISYLRDRETTPDPEVRALLVKACERGLSIHESVTVSGELQGGVLVEPRGGVRTHEERGEYQRELIALLLRLTHDEDAEIAKAATAALVGALHPLIDDAQVGVALADALVALDEDSRRRVRESVEYVRGLLRHHPNPDLEGAIDALDARLPAGAALEQLRILLATATWLLDEDEPRERLGRLLGEIAETGELQSVLDWLRGEEVSGSWQLGQALRSLEDDQGAIFQALQDAASTNLPAIAGYLNAAVQQGDDRAFDRVLDAGGPGAFEPAVALALTVRGPATDDAKRRARNLIAELPVAEAARISFSWPHRLSEGEVSDVLGDLIGRVATQSDYDALIDWASLAISAEREITDRLRSQLFELTQLVTQFPNVGRQRWDWCRIATRAAQAHPTEVAVLIFDRISVHELLILDSDPEAVTLCQATGLEPDAVWVEVARRLEEGDWRLSMVLRGWFSNCVPIAIIKEWVGESVERARVVAGIADPGRERPSEIGLFLLDAFGEDDEVRGALAGQYRSGTFVGPWSATLREQIAQLRGWHADRALPAGARKWAEALAGGLESQLEQAIRREEEGMR